MVQPLDQTPADAEERMDPGGLQQVARRRDLFVRGKSESDVDVIVGDPGTAADFVDFARVARFDGDHGVGQIGQFVPDLRRGFAWQRGQRPRKEGTRRTQQGQRMIGWGERIVFCGDVHRSPTALVRGKRDGVGRQEAEQRPGFVVSRITAVGQPGGTPAVRRLLQAAFQLEQAVFERALIGRIIERTYPLQQRVQDRFRLAPEPQQILVVEGEIGGLVEIRIVLHVGLAHHFEMAPDEQDEQFDVRLEKPLGQLAAATFVQQQQPVQQTFVVQPVAPPAIKVEHGAHLLRRRHTQQVQRVVQADLLHRVQQGLGGQGADEADAPLGRQNPLVAGFGVELGEVRREIGRRRLVRDELGAGGFLELGHGYETNAEDEARPGRFSPIAEM